MAAALPGLKTRLSDVSARVGSMAGRLPDGHHDSVIHQRVNHLANEHEFCWTLRFGLAKLRS